MSPVFFSDGHTPARTDTMKIATEKILTVGIMGVVRHRRFRPPARLLPMIWTRLIRLGNGMGQLGVDL